MSLEEAFGGEKKDNGRDTSVIEAPKPHTPEYEAANRINPGREGRCEMKTVELTPEMLKRLEVPCLFYKIRDSTTTDEGCRLCELENNKLVCDGYTPDEDYEKTR